MRAEFQSPRGLVAVLVTCVLAWQAVAGLAFNRRDVGRVGWSVRQRAWQASEAERLRAVLGDDFEIYQAVTAHVPVGRETIVAFRRRTMAPVTFLMLRTVLYPRKLRLVRFDGRRSTPLRVAEGDAPLYVLDLDSGFTPESATSEVLEEGESFRLLRIGSEPR